MATLLFHSIVGMRGTLITRPKGSWWPNVFVVARGTISLVEAGVTYVRRYPRCALIAAGTILSLKILESMASRNAFRYLAGIYLEQAVQIPVISSENARSQFGRTPLPNAHVVPGHAHADSAACRTLASNFCDYFAAKIGAESYFVQMSASDVRHGRNGNRFWYWGKDVNVEPSMRMPGDNDVISIIDTCYYMDMPRQLVQHFQHHVIYAFQPGAVSRSIGDYSYYFDNNGSVRYIVAGGAEYNHHVHNYGVDTICVKQSWCGIPYACAVYTLERKQVDKDHQVVLAAAVKKWTGLRAIVASFLLSGDQLKDIDVRDGRFARLNIVRASGVLISTGLLGTYGEITIAVALDTALKMKAKMAVNGLTLSSVSATLNLTMDDPMATLLHAYHKEPYKTGNAHYVFPAENAVHHYQFGPRMWDADARKTMVAFMSPFDDNCFAPNDCTNNEKRAILKRITEAKSKAETTPYLNQCALELAMLLGPKHSLRPVDEEEVFERQARPAQRRTLWEATMMVVREIDRRVKSFMKAESSDKYADPRLISTVDALTKLTYSQFCYALAEQFKQHSFYAFGKTPREVAERVVEVCANSDEGVVKTDFTKYDGHVSPAMRAAEQIILLYLFHPQYHNKLLDLHGAVQNRKAKTKYGETYHTDRIRLSGGPDTSGLNTAGNVVVAYTALRGMINPATGVFNTPAQAFAMLGVYGGDDGLSYGIEPKRYIAVALSYGQILKCELVPRGSAGVSFLARDFSPGVWWGCEDSTCDLRRQCRKFHVTKPLPYAITPLMKFEEKIAAFYLTDKWTPIIGDLARAWMRLKDSGSITTTRFLDIWNADVEQDNHFPNDYGDWMLSQAHEYYGADKVALFEDWAANARNLEDLLRPPLLRAKVQPAGTDAMVMEADMITPAVTGGDATAAPVQTNTTSPPCPPPKGGGRGRGGRGNARSVNWSLNAQPAAASADSDQPSKGRGRGKGGRGNTNKGKGRGRGKC